MGSHKNLLVCEDCGWRGYPEDCVLSLENQGKDLFSLECPKCGSEDLMSLDDSLVPA